MIHSRLKQFGCVLTPYSETQALFKLILSHDQAHCLWTEEEIFFVIYLGSDTLMAAEKCSRCQ